MNENGPERHAGSSSREQPPRRSQDRTKRRRQGRYHGFDHAFAIELPKAKEWLDEFDRGMKQ